MLRHCFIHIFHQFCKFLFFCIVRLFNSSFNFSFLSISYLLLFFFRNCLCISSFLFFLKSVSFCFSVLSPSLIAVFISAFARSITSFSFSSVHRLLPSRYFLKRTKVFFFFHSESLSLVLYF